MTSEARSVYFARAFLEHLRAASYWELAAWAIAIFWLISYVTANETPKVAGAPFAPKKWRFEPSAIQRLRFTMDARNVLQAGYDKFKDRVFIMPRVDRDITILPFKYLDEMRSLPRTVMNGTNLQILNLCAKYTYVDFMFHSDMLLRSVNKKLTPELNKYVEWAKAEMDDSFRVDMPQPGDWIELDIQHVVHKIISKMSAKVFLGYPICQNQEWIDISIQFTTDLFGTGFILKHFPEWLRPVVAPLIPYRWRLRNCVERGKRIVGEQIRAHRDNRAKGIEPEDTLLAWMLDNGTPAECELGQMTQRQLLLMLAGIHTTTMAIANVLFDLCSHPEWTPVLREEIEKVTAEFGDCGQNGDMPAKIWLSKLEKMDSFLIESQRFEPSTQLKPARVMLEEVTLKDGTHLPKGCMIAWAGHQHVHDPNVNEHPTVFDPMRSYRKRYANDKAEINKYIAGQNESTSLAFGYGNQACPGRYFAVNELKLMLARLINEYDWELPKGAQRPKSFDVEENLVLEPHCKIRMRMRKI